MDLNDLMVLKDKITRDPETNCWNWNKSTREGYGQITIDGVHWTTHRYVATIIFGVIPEGHVVRHSCDNRLCCNPGHLRLGTHKDNWKDSESVHRESHVKMRRALGWTVGDTIYPTSRTAQKETGLPMKTLMRHMKNGIFDLEAYRSGCKKRGVIPKV